MAQVKARLLGGMEKEFTKSISEAVEIKTSGRWAALNQKICQLAENHNGHEAWQIEVFEALCFKNFSEYVALKKAYEDFGSEPSLLAWRARNLLEISVWSIYCARSRENARAFYEDAGKDVNDLYEVFISWGHNASQGNDWLNPLERAKEDNRQRAEDKGIESLVGSYQLVREVAKKCGIEQHFKLHFKTLSKYAHPTAMLIIAPSDPGKEKLQKEMFYSHGCIFFVGAFTALEGVLSVLTEHPA